jgi:cbb3-type cytochrome oxidase subunit 3
MLQLYIFNAIGSIIMFGILLLLAIYPYRKSKRQR